MESSEMSSGSPSSIAEFSVPLSSAVAGAVTLSDDKWKWFSFADVG